MSKRSSLLTLAIAAIVAGSWPSGANAGITLQNGVNLPNGVNLANGLSRNGITLQNGMNTLNGLSTNGSSMHGVRLVLPDGTELAFR